MMSLKTEDEFAEVPAGEFWMGDENKCRVYLDQFQISRVPVTNAQYRLFVEATKHKPPGHWDGDRVPRDLAGHPVVDVTWHDALAYCRWLSEVTGKTIMLPSEAQWEKAARGTDGRTYPWGNRWVAERCNSAESGKKNTTPVWAYPEGASPYGLLDMAGNVWEWTRSLSKSYPYDPVDGREDLEAEGARVLRGGSFLNVSRSVRCAVRVRYYPGDWFRDGGFRVIRKEK